MPDLLCPLEDPVRPAVTHTVPVRVRIDGPTTPGRVTVLHLFEGKAYSDNGPSDDTASVVVTVTEGDDLPVTGSSTRLMLATGGLLLAVGFAGLLFVRRRRIRFTA